MTKIVEQYPSHHSMTLLSRLLLPRAENTSVCAEKDALKQELLNLCQNEFDDLVALADSNHVIVRCLEVILRLIREERNAAQLEWAQNALAAELARIETAMNFLHEICGVFVEHSYDVTVIKSLDHWPDLGSDVDLYTNAKPEDVCGLMSRCFHAQIAPRSWGDRLANKWNFQIPGLPELVEIHMGRLGQTGEQVAIASSLVERARQVLVSGRWFRIPSASDRLLISTLQRMYRHFYFRLCDIVDTASLADMGSIDYEGLRSLATAADIWEGVATYLVIVSDYVKSYRGAALNLPSFVTASAQFRGREVYYGRGFLRVPIMPQSARLYGSQLAGVLGKGELRNGARLSLLPWLATAAVVGQKITGSDKGIW